MKNKPLLEQIPASILAAVDYERSAVDHLSEPTLAWFAGGSGDEITLRANRKAFSAYAVIPRILMDMTQGHTRLHLLGHSLRHPILLAPVGHLGLLHPQAEVALAQAADATDTCLVSATLATRAMEESAAATQASKWFQLYLQPDRSDTLALIRRAETAGYTALVVTLDTPVQPPSRRARLSGFSLPAGLQPGNLRPAAAPPRVTLEPDDSILFQGMMSEAPRWADLEWLQSETRLPVIAKGVMHPTDAVRLRDAGIAGAVVSNHGGRALDGAPASLEALPGIRAAVGRSFPLLLDGGIRSGTDIFKALALGANAVLIGRLQGYALATAGALGVAHLLKLLQEELELCMALAGTPTLNDINPYCLTGATPC